MARHLTPINRTVIDTVKHEQEVALVEFNQLSVLSKIKVQFNFMDFFLF